MEKAAGFLSRSWVLGVLFVLVVINGALFLPSMSWIVPSHPGITGMPTVTHLQLSWTSEQFSHNLAEWSGEACDDPAHCTWAEVPGSLGDGVPPPPPPVPDGPAGFRRQTLLLDMTFPVLYSLFAVGLTIRLWELLDRRRNWLGLVVGAGAVAAVSDLIENSAHLWLLRGIDTWEQAAAAEFSGVLVGAASMFASIKYGILALFLASALVWLWVWRIRWMRRRRA